MEFTSIETRPSTQLVAIHPWERAMVQQRLEDLGIKTHTPADGRLVAILEPGPAGERQQDQIWAVIFRFRGRRGDLINWLESCWSKAA